MPRWRREQPAIERIRSGESLSPNEERFVLAEAMATETFGSPRTVRLKGKLDVARFRDAIQLMCDRHEARRTGFEPSEGGRFTRYVEARGRPEITWLNMPGASEAELSRAVNQWCLKRGDLGPNSLSRFLIVKVGPQDHLFGQFLHHATGDGETENAAFQEVFALYSGDEVAPLPAPYSEVWNWDWISSPAYNSAETYWRNKLSGVESVGGLPEDGGDAEAVFGEGPVQLALPAHLVAAARDAAAALGVSQFTFYYAACLVILRRLTGESRVCSTFQSHGRRSVPGSASVQGVFSNGLILATEVDESKSIAELAQRLKGEIREALDHEVYPYHHVIRATGLSPNFGVNWFPELPEVTAPGLEISPARLDYGAWEYDLNLRFIPDSRTGAVNLVLFFREKAFRRDRVAAIADQFAALLGRLSVETTTPLAEITSASLARPGLLPDPEAPLPVDPGELIHAAFLRQVRDAPARTAIVHASKSYSYAEVERRSRAVAGQLRAAGLKLGDRVGIVAERGPELVWTLLGAARLGAVFTVLDSAYPLPRLASQLEVCLPQVLVAAGGPQIVELAGQLAIAAELTLLPVEVDTDADIADLDKASPSDPAYILFTSGSTGAPKGVCCSHGPLSRFVSWQATRFDLNRDDLFSMLSGLSHDPLLRDIFTPLSIGATLVIPDPEIITAPRALSAWFKARHISVAHLTPAMGQLLVADGKTAARLPSLRRVFWGGDQLPPELVQCLDRLQPGVDQVNFYGATETPQAVGYFPCVDDRGRRATPVGKGVNGAQLLVMDSAKRPLGIGEIGEIAVRSNHLSLGFVEAGKLVRRQDARGNDDDPTLYLTGDYGLYLPTGDILLLGRQDDQIKIRGYRVELAEVTAALKAQPAVREAVTLAVGEGSERRIEAYVTLRRRTSVSAAQLLTAMSGRLPAYMLPRRVHVLASLPLSPNGKIDRAALQAIAPVTTDATAHSAGPSRTTAKERAIIEAWSSILGDSSEITPRTTFSGLGGDSLTYVQAYLAVEALVGQVPQNWPTMAISALASQNGRASSFWTMIETTMLVRAVAIVLVVVGHMHLSHYGGGATAALLVVSGFLLARLQLSESLARDSAKPILDGFWRLLIPTMLYSVIIYFTKMMVGKHPDLSVLTLTADFRDYSSLASHQDGHEMHLWFIHCMIQMTGLLYLGMLALRWMGAFDQGARRIALLFFVIGCLGRFVAPAILVPGFLEGAAARMTPLVYLPSTHLSTLMLGALIAFAETRRARLAVFIVMLLYSGLTVQTFGLPQAYMTLGASMLLFIAPRLPLPRVLMSTVMSLSGASLFIYLSHFPIRTAMQAVGAPDLPLAHVVAALIGGVFTWMAWTSLQKLFLRHARDADARSLVGAI